MARHTSSTGLSFWKHLILAIGVALGISTASGQSGTGYNHLDARTQAQLAEVIAKYRNNPRYLPGYEVQDTESAPGLPRVFAPTRPREAYTRYPWRRDIVATVFWIGETATPKNPVPNDKSSWDTEWAKNFGGTDDPNPANRTWDFCPRGFTPGQNPFYIALPYNDLAGWKKTKPTARRVIPWFQERYSEFGDTVIKGQWLAIRRGDKICYAQWEDVGPFNTDDWQYVFGDNRPATTKNNGAGLDVSPAVRDYLGLRSHQRCDWRFVDLDEVPTGPWRKYGDNNPFVQMRRAAEARTASAED